MLATEQEELRLEALRRYRILDSEREGTFDRITALVASIFNVPHACVSLVDEHRTWFKASEGIPVSEVERHPGLCATAIEKESIHYLEDASLDPVAGVNPLVECEGGIRFYAGVPLRSPDGHALGTLCVFGPEPRRLPEAEASWLQRLADFVMHEIEARRVRLELEHAEGALLQAQRLGSIGLMASGVAHDFNNLLGGIIGNAGLLQSEVPEDGAARKLVDEIDVVARRAAELVGQVLAYAGRDEGEVQVPVDLNSLVQQTRYMLDSVVHDRTLLEVSLTPSPAVVNGNPASIRQLIMNLITNASEAYAGEPGIVRLSTSVKDDRVELRVEDEGIGLSPDTRERIFDPFFTTKSEGRGLGLAVVRRILEASRGTIEVDSALDRGTSILISLPACPIQPMAEKTPRPVVADVVGAGTILVVDDQEAILNVARRILKRAGYSVLCACDGPEAIRLLENDRHRISVALLDMSMPVLSGVETLPELRKLSPDLKIVLSSGHTEEQARGKFEGHTIEGFLKKPYGPDELLEMLALVLAN